MLLTTSHRELVQKTIIQAREKRPRLDKVQTRSQNIPSCSLKSIEPSSEVASIEY